MFDDELSAIAPFSWRNPSENPERQAFTRELRELIEWAIDTLPDGAREVPGLETEVGEEGNTIYTTAMTFDISGRSVRWPDGSDGIIQQEGFDREGSGSRHAYVVRFRVERTGAPHITGGLRFTAAAHERMPGRNDEEKAEALALKIVSWVAQHGLTDGFFFRVDANDSGIEVSEA